MADDVTVEADSGGHTDNRPAITLLPTILALRDRLQKQFQYATAPRVGLAGGIATPASVAAAFAMGAAYVVTGSVNQACVESGSSDAVRKMLAEAGQADVTMAPAADMFEMGVKVQVLKRGTMFAMRAAKLYELYRAYPSWEAIPRSRARPVGEDVLPRDARRDLGADHASSSSAATRRKCRRPRPTRSTGWRSSSAGISGCRAGGRTPASRAGNSTTRSGAARRWARSTSGRRARSWKQPRNRTVVAVALNLLYGAA